MSQDPNAQFDHAVLDMIEHSPVGAVPHTPAYQDALRRLYHSHQAYPSADHKDGHVTARSLAKLPSFHAQNLDTLHVSQGEAEGVEANAAVFTRYVQSLPEPLRAKAESYRATVAGRPAHHRAKHGGTIVHDPMHSLFLVPGAGPNPGLPGNYLYGFIAEVNGKSTSAPWAVHLHDREDGAALFEAASLSEVVAKLEEVLESAPFHMSELEALGFRFI